MDKTPKLKRSIKYLAKKLKKVPTLNLNHPLNHSASWLSSGCKYPKTPSFDEREPDSNHTNNHTATLSDIDRFLFENFRSLYITDSSETLKRQTNRQATDHPANSAPSVTSSPASDDISEGESGVAIVTFSMDPYEDIRRSMKGMLDAHHMAASQPLDWDFMEELLFCYLELNDRSVHKHVLKAFSDLTARIRRDSDLTARTSQHSVNKAVSRRTVSNNRRKWKADQSEEEMLESLDSHDFSED